MKLKTLTLTFGAVLALSACVPSTQDQTPEPKPASSPEARQLADIGIDTRSAQQQVSRVGTNNAVNAGLAVGMGQSMGAGGLAAGALGWLASPGAGLAGSPNLIVDLPPGASIESYQARYAQSLYALMQRDLEAEGYKRVTLAKNPSYLNLVKDGCQLTRHGYYDRKCSMSFISTITKPPGGGTGNTYVVKVSSSGGWIRDYTTVAKQMADQHPELSLYLPPHKESGRMTGPSIYKNGVTKPL